MVRYEGGHLASRLKTEPETITAADFRLRRDSAGYRAGADGKDLGRRRRSRRARDSLRAVEEDARIPGVAETDSTAQVA